MDEIKAKRKAIEAENKAHRAYIAGTLSQIRDYQKRIEACQLVIRETKKKISQKITIESIS